MRPGYMFSLLAIICLALSIMLVQCSKNDNPNGGDDNPLDSLPAAFVADHTVVPYFDQIPDSVIRYIRNNFDIYYGHTSHGGQLISGMRILEDMDTLYTLPDFHEVGDDLGYNGDTSWAPLTRAYLDSHPETDIVIWSWCAGVSDNTEAGINIYLNKFNELEAAYPEVAFIYMTGHLDGTGISGNLYVRNNQIRAYCAAHEKILFDFADIESYDPDGNYYPDDNDECAWCADWCGSHDCPGCDYCAHSHCFNCYLKGRAIWYLLARLSGWNGN